MTEFLLKTLPGLDGTRRIGEPGRSIDSYGFRIIRKANGDDAYFQLLTRELDQTDSEAWKQRLLGSSAINTPITVETFSPLHQWIVEHIFDATQKDRLLEAVAEHYVRLLNEQSTDEATTKLLLSGLSDCKLLDESFWLLFRGRSTFFGGTPGKLEWNQEVARRAIDALSDLEVTPRISAQAAMMLQSLVNNDSRDLLKLDREEIANLVKQRLGTLADHPDSLLSMTKVDPSFADMVRPRQDRTTISGCSFDLRQDDAQPQQPLTKACEALELLELIVDLNATMKVRPECVELVHATTEMYLQLTSAINPGFDPFRPRSIANIGLYWPSLTVPVNEAANFGSEITPRHWLAFLIANRAFEFLPVEERKNLDPRIGNERLRWADQAIRKFSKSSSDALSLDEFEKLSASLNKEFEPHLADPDGNGRVTAKELVAYRELPSRPKPANSNDANENAYLQWARRLIAKYDQDGDGKLSANEQSEMLIKPEPGADTNGDGFITVSEYAEYRSRSR